MASGWLTAGSLVSEKSCSLPLSSMVQWFSPQGGSGGRGRRWEKLLFAFRVTHVLAAAEMDSLSEDLAVSGEWEPE